MSACEPILQNVRNLEAEKAGLQRELQTSSNKASIVAQIRVINDEIAQIKKENPHCFVSPVPRPQDGLYYGPFFVSKGRAGTSIYVRSGDSIKITSTGIVDFGGAVLGAGAPKLDANGDNWETPPNYPAPNLRKNSLIVKIGDKWYQGGTNTTFTTSTTGPIYLSTNDIDAGNNKGAWEVILYITQSSMQSPTEWFGPWVRSLYHDLIGRPPENENAVQAQVVSMRAGRPPRDVVNQFLTSQEYCYGRSYWMYKHFLDREPEPEAREAKGNQFMQGYPFQSMIAEFCESPEFKIKHPVPKEFVRFLYYKILSRQNDPEVNDPTGFQYQLSAINSITDLSNGLAAVTNLDGRVEVFAIGLDKKLYHRWQQTPGGSWTPKWESFGDAQILEGMSAAVNKDGRVEVFAIGLDKKLYHRWQQSPGGSWTAQWNGHLGGTDLSNGLAAVTTNDGRIEVFVVGGNKKIYRRWQQITGGSWTPKWESFGDAQILEGMSAAVNKDGRVEVFAIGLDKKLYHRWQQSPGGGGNWTAQWNAHLGGTDLSNGLAAVTTNDGRIEVFVVGGNKKLYHRWQQITGGSWTPKWESFGDAQILEGMSAAVNKDGRIEVFAIGLDKKLYHRWQQSPGGGGNWTAQWNGQLSFNPTINIINNFLRSLEYAYVTANEYFVKFLRRAHQPSPESGHVKKIVSGTALQEVIKDILCSEEYINGAKGRHTEIPLANCNAGMMWKNYPETQTVIPYSTCRPNSLASIVAIVREAKAAHKRVHSFGSKWSFSDCALTNDYVIDTTSLNREVQTVKLALRPGQSLQLYHVEAGISIRALYYNLDRLGLALETMGGASGQTLAGAISTGTHGGDKFIAPLSDSVLAIHLVGTGGTQFWIEPTQGITDPALLKAHVVPDIEPKNITYNDDVFNSCLISLGCMGVIYAVVLRVRQSYDLVETTVETTWQAFKNNASSYLKDPKYRFLQVLVNPYPDGNGNNQCLVTTRYETSATRLGQRPRGDRKTKIEAAIMNMIGSFDLLSKAKLIETGSLPIIDLGVWSDEEKLASIVLGVLKYTPQERPKLVEHYWKIILAQFPPGTIRGPSSSVMDIGYGELIPLSQPGHSIEMFFPTTPEGGRLGFIDFVDRAIENLGPRAGDTFFAGYISMRFTGPTRAYLGMQQWNPSCSVEISIVPKIERLRELLGELLNIGLDGRGFAHWGQHNEWAHKSHGSIYPRYSQWRQTYAKMSNNFSDRTFENGLSLRWNLTTPNDSQFVSQTVPEMMEVGQSQPVSITMKNTGTSTWTRSASYRLGCQVTQDQAIWGIHRVELPIDVPPGAQVTFQFKIVAPDKVVAPGTSRSFEWKMLQELVEWFGVVTPSVPIRIVPTANPRCQAIEREIASLQSQRSRLQAELRTATTGQKPALVDQINQINEEIQQKQTELRICLQG